MPARPLHVSFAAPRPLRIGLVNNMPDAALRATERQFGDLLSRAAMRRFGGDRVSLSLFHHPSLPRSPRARDDMAGRYADAACLPDTALDGLIVSGGEPSGPDLRAEPHWAEMARLIDWAWSAGTPTLWSCMGAHAAVLHLDGIERRPLSTKLSGVFAVDAVVPDPLIGPGCRPLVTPHSRGNTLEPDSLTRAGYTLLTASDAVGADVFAKRGEGDFLFTHGHPEYGPEVLGLEYRRDMRRFLTGERARPPMPPSDYFGRAVDARLAALTVSVSQAPSPDRFSEIDAALSQHRPTAPWRFFAEGLIGAWLEGIAASAAKQSDHRPAGLRRLSAGLATLAS